MPPPNRSGGSSCLGNLGEGWSVVFGWLSNQSKSLNSIILPFAPKLFALAPLSCLKSIFLLIDKCRCRRWLVGLRSSVVLVVGWVGLGWSVAVVFLMLKRVVLPPSKKGAAPFNFKVFKVFKVMGVKNSVLIYYVYYFFFGGEAIGT